MTRRLLAALAAALVAGVAATLGLDAAARAWGNPAAAVLLALAAHPAPAPPEDPLTPHHLHALAAACPLQAARHGNACLETR